MPKVKPETVAAVENFIADERIVELGELQRTGDEVLDVINLNENQHSDILAWLMDPREGHGQGDQILRDLLMAASTKVREGCGLDGRGVTAQFFAAWPPSRIRTTSFGSVFVARELGLPGQKRVDLFVFDPQNRFVLIIENKAGIAHTEDQLDSYKSLFGELASSSTDLGEFKRVYIALDRAFDAEDDSERAARSSWLHLGYSWLKTSARRALMHVERGNAAAGLVVSYCNRQTDWESPESKQATNLAASLHEEHTDAIEHLLKEYPGRLEKQWLRAGSDAVGMLFMMQNKGVVGLLRATKGMASVRAKLISDVPGLDKTLVESGKSWANVCPPGWQQLGTDDFWLAYLTIWPTAAMTGKFTLALVCDEAGAKTPEGAADFRKKLGATWPAFNKFVASQKRCVILDKGLTATELVKRVRNLLPQLEALAQ